MYETLTDIKTLIELEQTLNGLLSRCEYTEAIKLMESCKKIAKNFEKFPCCALISSRLSDTSKMAINNLDEVLIQQTIKYDGDRFNSLIEGIDIKQDFCLFTMSHLINMVILAYDLLNRQPGLIIEKIILCVENNIDSSMRKILGVEGDMDYDLLSIEIVCETKENSSASFS